jgi:hypothetical protein
MDLTIVALLRLTLVQGVGVIVDPVFSRPVLVVVLTSNGIALWEDPDGCPSSDGCPS